MGKKSFVEVFENIEEYEQKEGVEEDIYM